MAADDARTEPPPPPPPPPKERKWLPTFGVLILMAFLSLGGFFFAGAAQEALGAAGEDRLGDPVQVVPGVTVRPLQSWEVGEPLRFPLPGTVLEGVRLAGGGAFLDVTAGPGPTEPTDLWIAYVEGFLAAQAEHLQVTGEPEPFTTDQGVEGVRGSYAGVFPGVAAPVEGEVAALVMPGGVGAVAEGWAPEGQLAANLDAIRTMTATLEGG